jgi:hypothetical protein
MTGEVPDTVNDPMCIVKETALSRGNSETPYTNVINGKYTIIIFFIWVCFAFVSPTSLIRSASCSVHDVAVPHIINIFPAFFETRKFMPCSQYPVIGLHTGPLKFNPRSQAVFVSDNFCYVPHPCLGFPSGLLPSDFRTKMLYTFFVSPVYAAAPPVSNSLVQ